MPTVAVVPDRTLMLASSMPSAAAQLPAPVPEAFARDSILAWFRGEFAAANAIIDALLSHLTQLEGLNGGRCGPESEYGSAFAAIHRRRMNWIPILQMQRYFSIGELITELHKVVEKKKGMMMKDCKEESEDLKTNDDDDYEKNRDEIVEEEIVEVVKEESVVEEEMLIEKSTTKESDGDHESSNGAVEEDSSGDDSIDRKNNNDEGFEGQLPLGNIQICTNHDDCETRRAQIKITKGFIAKEPVKGHMASSIFSNNLYAEIDRLSKLKLRIYSETGDNCWFCVCALQVNVVKGLKLYENIFTDSELLKLNDYVSELRLAGRSGKLSGETFILFNQQLKGNKRELIQLGVPIFGQVKEEKSGHLEPIPSVLQAVIDHLTQWHLIPESRKPNSCMINFFDEGECSQPYLKPPHLDQPISTLLLSESTMAFGRVLVSDHNGNYKGPFMRTLNEGSFLVMRGNSADMARHVICPSANKRVTITFFKVRSDSHHIQSAPIPSLSTTAMTLWQPNVVPQPYRIPNGILNGYDPMELVPKWGVLHSPLVMFSPMRHIAMSPRKAPNNGTGVFLPWTVRSKKPAKHLPPRAQRARLLALPSSMEKHGVEPNTNSAVAV